LNKLAAAPKAELLKLRKSLQAALSDEAIICKHGIPVAQVQMHLPVKVEGFVDFSCSKEHMLNAHEAVWNEPGVMPPGALHFPIGYSGRASSIVVSGTDIRRPYGQYYEGKDIVFGPSKWVDFELEMGCIIGKPSKFGERVSVKDADDHIFGIVLVNDWSGEQHTQKPQLASALRSRGS